MVVDDGVLQIAAPVEWVGGSGRMCQAAGCSEGAHVNFRDVPICATHVVAVFRTIRDAGIPLWKFKGDPRTLLAEFELGVAV